MIWLPHRDEFAELAISNYKKTHPNLPEGVVPNCRNVTFQVTEDCNCACTYCYQGNKTKKVMSLDTGDKILDQLFGMYDSNKEDTFITKKETIGLVLDFIGGEPFLNIDLINHVCTKFMNKCILEDRGWKNYWSASLSSNGALYFQPKVQEFIERFRGHLSLNITVDGPKEIHDACRIYKDGSGGNFNDAYAALMHYKSHYNNNPGTKVTIAKENLPYLNSIVRFFTDNGITSIYANTVFEHAWTHEEATLFYQQLKQLADFALNFAGSIFISLFDETGFAPMDEVDNKNWCGGTGSMLAFDPDGTAYPCLRYMPSSLGKAREPIIIGDCIKGIYTTEQELKIRDSLESITRRSQSTDECFYCPIAGGCAWCSAWNYQETGSVNQRSVRICNAHKARSLANVYFWNKYYLQEHIPKTFHRYLSDEESLKFIDQKELDMLNDLENQTKHLIQEVE